MEINTNDIKNLINFLQGTLSDEDFKRAEQNEIRRNRYYDIKEDFGNIFSIPPKINAMIDILDMYPNLKSMTCEDALEWLKDRYVEKDLKLQEKLGVI